MDGILFDFILSYFNTGRGNFIARVIPENVDHYKFLLSFFECFHELR